MPRGDQTGPIGMGNRTGRAAGYCAGFGGPGYANSITGGGFGKGCRFHSGGRGCRNVFHATGRPGWMRFGGHAASNRYQTTAKEHEKQLLEGHADALRVELDAIEKRRARTDS